MGGFGASVKSLLDTYSRCIALLKGLEDSGEGSGAAPIAGKPSQLRRSVRSDRAKLRRAYSSQLSLNGDQLEKGDAVAKSSLKKVIKRLKRVMARLLDTMAGVQRLPAIDYQSLQTLSSSSRIDAVSTIDELSRRMSSSVPKGRGPATKAHYVTASESSSSSTRAVKTRHSCGSRRSRDRAAHPKSLHRIPSPRHDRAHGVPDKNMRASMATMASDSTKLGEIGGPTKLKRRRPDDVSFMSVEYRPRPTYPLRPFQPEVKRRRFWGLLGPL